MSIQQPHPTTKGGAWQQSFDNADLDAKNNENFEQGIAESLRCANLVDTNNKAALDAEAKRAADAAKEANAYAKGATFAGQQAAAYARVCDISASYGEFLNARRMAAANRKAAAEAQNRSESHVHEHKHEHEHKHGAGDAWQPADADADLMAEINQINAQCNAYNDHEAIQRSNYTTHRDDEVRADRKAATDRKAAEDAELADALAAIEAVFN
jgi:hypothetical protein